MSEVFEMQSILKLFETVMLLFCSVYNHKVGNLLIYRVFLELVNPRLKKRLMEILMHLLQLEYNFSSILWPTVPVLNTA